VLLRVPPHRGGAPEFGELGDGKSFRQEIGIGEVEPGGDERSGHVASHGSAWNTF
jgi:hypothetical protein